ncbi:T9SS type A sorting domain-containing protein [Chryseobacterium sp. PBS4-4]|uniref:T9SS type A sorting domain-containing protein n=1 Tax=Chryseobacterium edaphi TaxID=2976532 RepID=A0ABT2WAK8_9FLAO|nr:T9SS type A sorting domain-containing protein [Chryseobacterium edaphi]
MKKNHPNAFRQETVFSIDLEEKSAVSIELFEADGKKLFSVLNHQNLSAGKQEIKISRNQLDSGIYTAKITIENSKGEFIENIEVIVH